MDSIYSCRHIFLVYSGGGGGNWVSRLISNLREGNLEKISLTSSGSSHSQVDLKNLGEDHICFGTIPTSLKIEHHSPVRHRLYLDKISRMEVKDLVVWSHDFSNIELYRKYFPQSKVLAIIAHSPAAKLSNLFMRINKINFDISSTKPYSIQEDRRVQLTWTLMIKQGLVDHGFTDQQSRDIIRSNNRDLLLYAAVWSYLNYYALLGYLESGHAIGDRFDRVLYPQQCSIDFINRYINCDPIDIELSVDRSINRRWDKLVDLGELNCSYLDSQVVQMDYNIFVSRSTDQFVEIIRSVLDRELTVQEQGYIKSQFEYYIDHQDPIILSNPRQYYHNIKRKFFETKGSL